MKPILKIKISVDAAMSVFMLLLMAYGLVGEAAHEWIGMGMFALFVAHHVLNRRWIKAVPQGHYTPLRLVQTALIGLIFLCMVGSMVSGIVLSRHVFAFLPKHGGYELAGKLHILCAFWGFVLMSLHLGLHLAPFANKLKKHRQFLWAGRIIAVLLAAYGVYVFVDRAFYEELFYLTEFKFFDTDKSAALYFFETVAMSSAFATLSYYGKKLLQMKSRQTKI